MGEISDGLPWIGDQARAALELADDGIARLLPSTR
jgi:asparagine synthase (glutamine-hydrolysing)